MRSTALRRMVAAHLDTDIISHCRNLRHGSRPSTSSAHAGLALRPELTSARGFADLVKNARRRTDDNVRAMVDNDRKGRPGDALRLIDNVSNDLCRVLDLSEFLRQAHPDANYRQAATEALIDLGGTMSELNVNHEFYSAFKNFSTSPAFNTVGEEGQKSTLQLLHDFEAAGIALPDNQRQEVVKIIAELENIRMELEALMHAPGPSLELSMEEAAGLPDNLQYQEPDSDEHSSLHHDDAVGSAGQVQRSGGKVTIPYSLLRTALQQAENPTARKKIAQALYASSPELDAKMRQLLELRHQLAQRVGFPSHADRELSQSMAQRPAVVMEFLKDLSNGLQDILPGSLAPYGAHKNMDGCHITYLMSKRLGGSVAEAAAPYMTLPMALAGCSSLIQILYGVTFKPVEPEPGEIWHPTVWKFHVVEADGTVLGTLYCDLINRPFKNRHASHFTLQSARGLGTDGDGRERQLPQVALVCGFSPPRASYGVVLSFQEMYTLFHEIGHALHSLLSEVTYQNVAGTRGSMDFGELPSSFFELFLRDERTLSLVARHYSTGQCMPQEMARQLIKETFHFQDVELENGLLLSAMDQLLHSPAFQQSGASLLDGVATVSRQFTYFNYDGEARYSKFDHILGYGSIYYSYLWCQALGSLLWQHCFADDPFNKEAGQSIRRNILSKGSGRDPWAMVEAVLGKRPTMVDLSNALLQQARS